MATQKGVPKMDKPMDCPSDMDLLLIGKTGNGKSATGNTILRRKAFKSMSSTSSVTIDVHWDVSEFKGRVLKVVDVPGVGDTRMTTEGALQLVRNTMEYAIACNPRGYHAFLLVVRFGGRFTEEDKDTIAFLKSIFGAEFIKNFCILVMSCGDSFASESEESGITFEEWCKEQEGVFQDLLKECDNRAIILDNITKDEDKKTAQLQKLVTMVDNLRFRGNRYNDENFQRAKDTRDRLAVEAKKPMIKEETLTETSLIIKKLDDIQKIDDSDKRADALENLLTRTEALNSRVSSLDHGTGALRDLVDTIKSTQKSISEEIKSCFREKRERERLRKFQEETKKQLEEEMVRQQERLRQMKLEEDRRDRTEKERREAEDRKKREAEEKKRRAEEEKRKREAERMERELKAQQEADRRRHQEQIAALEKKYQQAKAENEKGFFGKVVDTVTWPLRSVVSWFTG